MKGVLGKIQRYFHQRIISSSTKERTIWAIQGDDAGLEEDVEGEYGGKS